jgi:hypothetical protein
VTEDRSRREQTGRKDQDSRPENPCGMPRPIDHDADKRRGHYVCTRSFESPRSC